MTNKPFYQRSVGGKRPQPGNIFELVVEHFLDHNGSLAMRVYQSNQLDLQERLAPLWTYQMYVPFENPEFDWEAFARDAFNTFTDDRTLLYWRFEIFPVSASFTHQNCADHYRREKAARNGLAFPDYERSREYSGFLLIVRDPLRWKPNGMDIYMFDLDQNHLDPYEPETLPEQYLENAWLKMLLRHNGEDIIRPPGKGPSVGAYLDGIWYDHPDRKTKYIEAIDEARERLRASPGGSFYR